MKHFSFYLFLIVFVVIGSCKQENPLDNGKNLNTKEGLSSNSPANCNNPDAMSHFISLEYAYSMINNYQNAVKSPNGLCDIIGEGGEWTFAETFPREAIQKILEQPGCCKFRIYYGLDRDNRMHQILVGVNSNDEDILYAKNPNRGTSNNPDEPDPLPLIVEQGLPCPQGCKGVYQN